MSTIAELLEAAAFTGLRLLFLHRIYTTAPNMEKSLFTFHKRTAIIKENDTREGGIWSGNGLSLFNLAMPEDLKALDNYAKARRTAYVISFERVCQEVMGPVQTQQLQRLVDFAFQLHPRFSLPEDRLTAIERHVQKRVHQLLDLT